MAQIPKFIINIVIKIIINKGETALNAASFVAEKYGLRFQDLWEKIPLKYRK